MGEVTFLAESEKNLEAVAIKSWEATRAHLEQLDKEVVGGSGATLQEDDFAQIVKSIMKEVKEHNKKFGGKIAQAHTGMRNMAPWMMNIEIVFDGNRELLYLDIALDGTMKFRPGGAFDREEWPDSAKFYDWWIEQEATLKRMETAS